jgi:hypothetical protein
MRVLARAYGDRPLDRVVAEKTAQRVYVSTPSALSANDSAGVGFPLSCVFEFDESLYRDLEGAWREGDSARVAELWARAQPLGQGVA